MFLSLVSDLHYVFLLVSLCHLKPSCVSVFSHMHTLLLSFTSVCYFANKEKASVKVSTDAQGQNKLHVGAAVSYCAVQNIGIHDQNGFNAFKPS